MALLTGIIHTEQVCKELGDYLSILSSEYLCTHIQDLVTYGQADEFNNTYDWLTNHIDFSDEISDAQALDDMYITTANRLTEALATIYMSPDYLSLKYYLLTHREKIVELDFNNRETYVLVNIITQDEPDSIAV